mgnify:CR=1 FL=1
MGGAVVVVHLPVCRVDVGEGRADAVADESQRIPDRRAVAGEIDDGVAASLPHTEHEGVVAGVAGELVGAAAAVERVVAGIAEAYQPEQLVGRTIAIVFNLKPAKLMGIESNGMVLAASVGDGKPILVGFDEPVPPGARVR